MDTIIISPELPPNDVLLLRNLAEDIKQYQENRTGPSNKDAATTPGQEAVDGGRSIPLIRVRELGQNPRSYSGSGFRVD